MINILKYLNQYYISVPIDLNTKRNTKNPNDTYLKGVAGTETYRENSNTLAIYMPKGKSTSNSVIPKLANLGVTLTPKILADEEIWLFPESDIHTAHKVLKFGIVGKNDQVINPKTSLVTTKEKLKKMLDRVNKDK